MNPMLAWAVVLLLLGLGLAVLEFFLPSHGLLGTLSAISLLCAIVLAFLCGPAIGVGLMVAVMVILPVALVLAVRYWPSTPLGKRILLEVPQGDQVLPDDEQRRQLRELLGQIGRAKSRMLPCGAADFGGKTIDVVSEGVAIEPGQFVKVIEVRGSRVVVRPAENGEVKAASSREAAAGQETASPQKRAEGQEAGDLSRPIDSIGLNPFEDPLA